MPWRTPLAYLALATARHGSLADNRERIGDVRFIPGCRHAHLRHRCPLSARSGHCLTRAGQSVNDFAFPFLLVQFLLILGTEFGFAEVEAD